MRTWADMYRSESPEAVMIDVSVPGAVYDWYLSDHVTEFAAEENLPSPSVKRRGRGRTVTYRVSLPQAVAIQGYLTDRSDLMLGPGADAEPEDYTARKVARRLEAQINQAYAEVTA